MNRLFEPEFRDLLSLLMRQMRSFRSRRAEEGRARRQSRATSGSFIGHRAYSAGEDLRLVDWNAYARTGEVFIKILEEDQRQTLTILVDCSSSMLAGNPARFIGTRRLIAVLGALALARLDGLRLVCSAKEITCYQGARDLSALLHDLEAMTMRNVRPMQVLKPLLEAGRLGGLCWVSDFAVPEDYQRALRLLRYRGRRCTALLPGTSEDRIPAVNGYLQLEDPESGEVARVRVDSGLRSAMQAELSLLTQQQDSMFRELGIPLRRFQIPAEGDYRLPSWFPGSWIYRI